LGIQDVSSNLIPQVCQGRKLLLGAEFLHEHKLEILAVQIVGKIEKVCFDAELWLGILHSGSRANVNHRPVESSARSSLGGIHPIGRQYQARDVEVGSGKAELPPKLVARDNLANEGIASAEHLAGCIQVAGDNCLPNPSTANRLAIEGDRRQAVDDKAEFRTKLAKQFNIPAALMAEHKIGADANAANLTRVASQRPDEVFPATMTKFLIKVNEQSGIDAKRLDDRKLLAQGID
jgi:hypothetical protein